MTTTCECVRSLHYTREGKEIEISDMTGIHLRRTIRRYLDIIRSYEYEDTEFSVKIFKRLRAYFEEVGRRRRQEWAYWENPYFWECLEAGHNMRPDDLWKSFIEETLTTLEKLYFSYDVEDTEEEYHRILKKWL
jgi:hypothetical protein